MVYYIPEFMINLLHIIDLLKINATVSKAVIKRIEVYLF